MLKLLIFLLLLPSLSYSYAAQVFEKQGNLYYQEINNKVIQLTDSGRDGQFALSPDGKHLVFVRAAFNSATEQLLLMNIENRQIRVLLKAREDQDVKKNLTEFNSPNFSPDSKMLYVLTAAWVTSNAVHLIDLATNQSQFVTDANSLQIVPAGQYQGYLIVSKHKYYKGGGSYDDYWLVSPQGKEIKSLGEDEQAVALFLKQQ